MPGWPNYDVASGRQRGPVTFPDVTAPAFGIPDKNGQKDIGAVGDGVNDDYRAFQNAVTANEASGGGPLLVPPGTYRLSASLSGITKTVFWCYHATFTGPGAASVAPAITYSSNGAVSFAGSLAIAGPNPWIDVSAASVVVAGVTYTLGAKFDGTGDDGVAINNAYTAALNVPNGGATVLMPPGTARVATQIVPVNNATLQGAGDGATILQWFGANSVPMIGNAAPSGSNQLGKSHFKFFKLDTRNTTGVGGMILNSWFQSVIEDVWINNATTAGTYALTLACGATGGSTSYNWIRGVRLTSCDGGLKLSGKDVNSVVTNNYWYGLAMDDVITTGFNFVQWSDTNTFFGTRVGARTGTVWTGLLFNSTGTPNADVGVYNARFFGLALDNTGGSVGTNAITMNWCYGILIEGLWTSIGPGGSTGTLINDTNGATNAQSYRIELMESTGVPGSKATQYVKGYVKARSRQVVAFVTPYTPDPTAGEIVEFGTLTASVTINAPSPQPAQATGQLLTFRFTQNGVGGWVIAWNAVFKTLWQPSPQALATSAITFYWDGTSYRQLMGDLVNDLGRTQTPAELIVGGFLNAGTSINSGTTTSVGTHLLSAQAGAPATSNLGANVTSCVFTGNDLRGKIVIVMAGALAANTRIATCTFIASFGASAPGLILLVNQTSGVGLAVVNFYVLATSTGVSFDLACDQALAAGTYTIDYVVIG